MTKVKKLRNKDYASFVDIVANAYPGMKITTAKDKEKFMKRLMKISKDPKTNYYGLFRKNKLFGGMALYDFTMNMFSIKVNVGGVGLVAVDLLRKKELVCKKMIQYFHELYKRKDIHMLALYPFRPDFYRKMGFGYGTKISEYSIRPIDLPRGKSKKHTHFLTRKDTKALKDCYYRIFVSKHGMMSERESKWQYLFDYPECKVVGYKKGKKVLGYLIFTFRKAQQNNWLKSDILIREFFYESREVFLELLMFLHTQLDQVNRIIWGTHDDMFHYVPFDPRNGTDNIIAPLAHETNVQGLGIMYKVINVKGIFRELRAHSFNEQSCRLKISVKDSFFEKKQGSTIVHFNHGKASVRDTDDYEVETTLDICDFSSLLMGVVDFKTLFDYGIVEISSRRYLNQVNRIFATETKPICTTQF